MTQPCNTNADSGAALPRWRESLICTRPTGSAGECRGLATGARWSGPPGGGVDLDWRRRERPGGDVRRARHHDAHPRRSDRLPGGAQDPEDVDLADTALREAAEETGLDRTGVEVLGRLPPVHVAVSGFDVTAVVAWWQRRSPGPGRCRGEVASVWMVPVGDLVDLIIALRFAIPPATRAPPSTWRAISSGG